MKQLKYLPMLFIYEGGWCVGMWDGDNYYRFEDACMIISYWYDSYDVYHTRKL